MTNRLLRTDRGKYPRCTKLFVPALCISSLLMGTYGVGVTAGAPGPGGGGGGGGGVDLEMSLKSVPVPEPPNLLEFIKTREAAIALGKSLFWDMQVGGDGAQACASCHFQAGTDGRFRNVLNPGANGVFEVGGPNHTLIPGDFPFASDDIVGGQGLPRVDFLNIVPGSPRDDGTVVADPVNNVGGANTRQLTGRNTPTVINAVFNVRNFWDGRANFVFNGVNPFGLRDTTGPTIVEVQADGTLLPVSIALVNSSLASQAVGPPNNEVEMSFLGRSFPELGRKMLSLKPLAQQIVDRTDSVLGPMVDASGRGLGTTYADMIRAAFVEKFWDSAQLTADGFSAMEANFSLFFGLSIQVYESTLVSDDSPFDRFSEGDDNALTDQQKSGFGVFTGKGKCDECHEGAEFTSASFSETLEDFGVGIINQMAVASGVESQYDNGFYNIGVRPTADDLGVGGVDPFGTPKSFTRLVLAGIEIGPPFTLAPVIDATLPAAVDGAFKTPTLRNVELTAPYMHTGGLGTLEQVVDFYSRGGNFPVENADNLDPDITELGFGDQDSADLVAFLMSLTDERVRMRAAPFDHPQLFVPNGHVGDSVSVLETGQGLAADCFVEITATGAAGAPEDIMLGDCVANAITTDPFPLPPAPVPAPAPLPVPAPGPAPAPAPPPQPVEVVEPDSDGDGVPDKDDNCPMNPNPDQADGDGDGIADMCDNCPQIPNAGQEDVDRRGGGDGVGDACDNCLHALNARDPETGEQNDDDGDGVGDACDLCPNDPDPTNVDSDFDGLGDVCDDCDLGPNIDADGDGVFDDCDLCPLHSDPTNADTDGDLVGDVCDNCPFVENDDQRDRDGDTVGDQCDNCRDTPNSGQRDADGDGKGDVCDNDPQPQPEQEQEPEAESDTPAEAQTGSSSRGNGGSGSLCGLFGMASFAMLTLGLLGMKMSAYRSRGRRR